MKNKIYKSIKENWKSGLTVSLVSVPLAVSLAVASGATPEIGIITAIWAGLVAAIFGGSNYNIIGPTGALSGLIAGYLFLNGLDSLATLTVLTGLIILAAYFLKLERYLIFVPSSVIHGFTLGVAFIIAFNQFNFALGINGLEKHERFFLNMLESFKHVGDFSEEALLVFAGGLFALFILRKLSPKIPGALVVSGLGILIGYFSHLDTLGSVFGEMKFSLLRVPQFQISKELFVTAGGIALVAILETMLSARIADEMTKTRHDERKEMLGLSLANLVSGFVGGMPATAALARTSLNIKSGANHKSSATISAVMLIVIAFFLLQYFKFMPMALIASILVFVAIQMVELEHFVKFFKYERHGFYIALLVAAVTIYEDPIFGIVFGTAFSLIIFVEKISRGHFDIHLNTFEKGLVKIISGESLKEIKENADILLYSINGKLVFVNSRAHVSRFETNLVKYKIIILRLRNVYFMDLDGAAALDEIIGIIRKRGQTVCLSGISEDVRKILEKVSKGYEKLNGEGLVFENTPEALKHFGVKGKS